MHSQILSTNVTLRDLVSSTTVGDGREEHDVGTCCCWGWADNKASMRLKSRSSSRSKYATPSDRGVTCSKEHVRGDLLLREHNIAREKVACMVARIRRIQLATMQDCWWRRIDFWGNVVSTGQNFLICYTMKPTSQFSRLSLESGMA